MLPPGPRADSFGEETALLPDAPQQCALPQIPTHPSTQEPRCTRGRSAPAGCGQLDVITGPCTALRFTVMRGGVDTVCRAQYQGLYQGLATGSVATLRGANGSVNAIFPAGSCDGLPVLAVKYFDLRCVYLWTQCYHTL